MNIEEDFVWVAGNAFSEMRLLTEGAIVLYEDDAVSLFKLAAEDKDAQAAFNTIGKALYLLREQVKMLEDAHRQETLRA